jgi:hypothetical protein
MTTQHNISANDFFKLFCAELDQFQEFCFAKEDEFNSCKKKDPQAIAILSLAIQSFDFARGLKALHANGKSSSSQMTLLRSLLECVVRIKYIDLYDQVGLNNLIRTDLDARIKRYKVAEKVWPKVLDIDDQKQNAILSDKKALEELEKKGFQIIKSVEVLLAKIGDKNSEVIAAELYSAYRELCPPAHSDLDYLLKRLFTDKKSPFSCESEIYECATYWLRSAGHDLNLSMNRLKASNA